LPIAKPKGQLMQKSSKRAMRAVMNSSEGSATTVRRDALVLSNQLKIPLVAALELAKMRGAKRRERLRRDHLRAVINVVSTPLRERRRKLQ